MVLTTRTRIHQFASRLHKWLALIIGAQLLIWFSSGALMSFLPIEKVRGEHLVDRDFAQPIPQGLKLADPALILKNATNSTTTIAYRMIDGRPVAELASEPGPILVDATTGERLPAIDATTAIQIARRAWISDIKPEASATRLDQNIPAYRGPLPAWQVNFSDPDNTRVYVVAATGRIGGVRTGTWRLYDFFWGLHIMDWKDHENFNTPWLLAFALGGLILGLAGTALLIFRWPFRRRGAASGRGS